MPEPSIQSDIAEIVAGAAAAAAAIVFGLQKAVSFLTKARVDVAESSAKAAQANAQADVVHGLRDELARMTEQNAKLAMALNQLQLEVVGLRTENAELRQTIQTLHGEVARLSNIGTTK